MKTVAFFESIFQKRVAGIKPGLSRMQKAYEALGRPAADIPTILVGGTNGKGSTAGFLYGMLQRMQVSVGLYTSPHLLHFAERFQMSHVKTTDEELVGLIEEIRQNLPVGLYDDLSFFEIATLMSLCLFARHSCQFLILEVGLGGRWDATNVVEPLAAVVVSISRDHEVYLGEDLGGIAREKLAIGRAGKTLFWGCSGELLKDSEAVRSFSQTVKELGLQIRVKGLDFFRDGEKIAIHLPSVRSVRVNMPSRFDKLAGFLQENFVLALAVYHWLADYGWPKSSGSLPSIEILLAAIEKQSLPRSLSMVARCQKIIVTDPGSLRRYPLVFDVCHNPDGVRVLGESLRSMVDHPPALVSILADKKIDEMLDQLKNMCGPIVLFEIEDPRSMKRSDLADRHCDLPYFESFSKAWQHALKVWHNHQTPWLVCGSVLAVGQILNGFDIQPFEAAHDNI